MTTRNRFAAMLACTMQCLALRSQTSGAQTSPSAPRDSAGITIRAITPPNRRGGLAISPKPLLDLGGADATGPFEFNRIRALTRTRDGSLIVADGASLELRVFDSTGRFVRRIGRKGSGPGEIQSISRVLLVPRDSLLVSDELQRRYVVFAPSGEHVRTVAWTPPSGARVPSLSTVLSDGTMIVAAPEISTAQPRAEPYYFRQHVWVAAASGFTTRDLGSFRLSEHFVQTTTPERGGVAYYDLAYGRTMTIAARGRELIVGDGSTFELRSHDAAGRLTSILRSNEPRQRLTQLDRDGYRARLFNNAKPAEMPGIKRLADEMPYPTYVPAFDRFFVAEDRRLWVHRYQRAVPATDSWVVINEDGSTLDEVVMPPRFSLLYAGAGFLLGVGRDEDEVEHVRVYRVTRRG